VLVDPDGQVEGAGDLGRVAAGVAGRDQDAVAHGRDLPGGGEAERGDPAVGQAAGDGQGAVAVGAEPDGDVVARLGLDAGALGPVQAPGEAEGLLGPQAPQDADGLLQAVDLVAGRPDAEAEGGELLVHGAPAQAQDQPPAREPVQRLGHLGDHRRRPQRRGQHARGHADP